MNKELEEAKQKLEKFVGLFYEFPNPTSISIRDYEVEAIKTVLNYIENSIPKKRIEEKINRFKDETVWNYNDWKYDEKIYKAELNIIDKIMKELLEEE